MKGKLNLTKLKEEKIIELTENERADDFIGVLFEGKKYGLKINEKLFRLKVLNEIFDIKRNLFFIKIFGIIFSAVFVIMIGLSIWLAMS